MKVPFRHRNSNYLITLGERTWQARMIWRGVRGSMPFAWGIYCGELVAQKGRNPLDEPSAQLQAVIIGDVTQLLRLRVMGRRKTRKSTRCKA
jgi:hypothetical protein